MFGINRIFSKILILFDPTSEDIYQEISVPSRPLRRLRINIPDDQNSTDYVISLIKEHNDTLSYKNALIKIEITINGENKGINKKEVEDYIYSLGAFHISSLSESRNISVVTQEKRELLDNTIEPKSAIKLYSDTIVFNNEQEKYDFMKECFDIVDEVKDYTK